jgi:hypothetical protein
MVLGHSNGVMFPGKLSLIEMKTFVLLGIVVFLRAFLETTYGSPLEVKANPFPEVPRLDLLEATLRYRLKMQPLPKGATCYVYVNRGLGKGLRERLADYRIVERSGSVGPTPPKQRWYWLDIGKVTEHNASVVVEDARFGFKVVQLRKHGARWIVVIERAYYLTSTQVGMVSRAWVDRGQSTNLDRIELISINQNPTPYNARP